MAAMNSHQNKQKPDPDLRTMTMQEICEILKLRPQSVYRLIRQKRFIEPVRFTANRTLFYRAEFEAWIAKRERARPANDNVPGNKA